MYLILFSKRISQRGIFGLVYTQPSSEHQDGALEAGCYWCHLGLAGHKRPQRGRTLGRGLLDVFARSPPSVPRAFGGPGGWDQGVLVLVFGDLWEVLMLQEI